MSATSGGAPDFQGDFFHGLRQALDLILSGDSRVISTTLRTLRVAAEATVIATAVGLPLGCLLGVGRFRGRRTLLALANGLTKVPPVAIGVLALLLLTEESPWGGGPLSGLHWYTTFSSIYLVQTLLAVPIIIGLTATAVQSVSPGLLEQARAFGAPGWRRGALALREARAGVVAGIIVAMGVTITAIGAILVATGPLSYGNAEPATLATGALTSFKSQYGSSSEVPLGVAYATILLGLFVVVAAALMRLQRRGPSWRAS